MYCIPYFPATQETLSTSPLGIVGRTFQIMLPGLSVGPLPRVVSGKLGLREVSNSWKTAEQLRTHYLIDGWWGGGWCENETRDECVEKGVVPVGRHQSEMLPDAPSVAVPRQPTRQIAATQRIRP